MRNRTHEAWAPPPRWRCAPQWTAARSCGRCRLRLAAGVAPARRRQGGARSYRRTRLERRSLVARRAGRLLRLPMTIFAAVAQHRGAKHWLPSGAATTVVLAVEAGALWAPLRLPVIIGCGYGAHLLADACTPHGAPLLGPISARRVRLLPPRMRLATGGAGDLLVLIAATLTAAALGLLVLQAT